MVSSADRLNMETVSVCPAGAGGHPLLDAHGVPGQVKIDQLVAKLQVVALAAGLGADHHPGRLAEAAHRLGSLQSRHPPVKRDRLDPVRRQRGAQGLDGGPEIGKNQEFAGNSASSWRVAVIFWHS